MKNKFYDPTATAQNKYGEWVPAIEEPYFLPFGRTKCRCGKTFWGRRRYREHYALEHVMGLE
jgi:hypothetical protein